MSRKFLGMRTYGVGVQRDDVLVLYPGSSCSMMALESITVANHKIR